MTMNASRLSFHALVLLLLLPAAKDEGCGPSTVPIGGEGGSGAAGGGGGPGGGATCDATLVCAQVLTCIDGKLYPTACGPDNCDAPTGDCVSECDPTLVCAQVVTCVNGKEYPTACGPTNCDAPLGDCTTPCDPTLVCAQVITCVDGQLYPTGCGPANCDEPIGDCSAFSTNAISWSHGTAGDLGGHRCGCHRVRDERVRQRRDDGRSAKRDLHREQCERRRRRR